MAGEANPPAVWVPNARAARRIEQMQHAQAIFIGNEGNQPAIP